MRLLMATVVVGALLLVGGGEGWAERRYIIRYSVLNEGEAQVSNEQFGLRLVRGLFTRSTEEKRLLGDLDGDGMVGFADFFLLAERLGEKEASLDLNGSGRVDEGDLQMLAARFGQSVAGKRAGAPVPLAAGTRLGIKASVGEERGVSVDLQWERPAEIVGYGCVLAFDPGVLQFIGMADSSGIRGRILLREEEGRLVVATHRVGNEGGLGGDLLRLEFVRLGDIEGGWLQIETAQIHTAEGRTLGVEHLGAVQVLPTRYALGENYPNPFNPETTLPVSIPERVVDGEAQLAIYSALGQVVRVWELSGWNPGFHRLVWDGRDEVGHPVGSGMYIARLQAGGFLQTRKLLLLR